jgi:1-acyl-sn-glycerol-3-phosphate acyltransferase
MVHPESFSPLTYGTQGCVEFLLPNLLSKGIEIKGKENIPNHGGHIIVLNHMAWVEALLPMLYVSPQPRLVIKQKTMEDKILGPFAKAFHAIGIERDTYDKPAIDACVDTLTANKNLIIFPEGTRGKTKEEYHHLKIAEPGTLFIAKRAAAATDQPITISPWAIWGTEAIFPRLEDTSASLKERLLFTREKIHVAVGKPFLINPETNRMQLKESLQPGIDQIMLAIRDMLPEQYHGVYKGIPTPENPTRSI